MIIKQQVNSSDKTERCEKNDRLSKKGPSSQHTTEQSKVTLTTIMKLTNRELTLKD